MARKITIPITDHEDHCNTGYTVSYKLDGEELWNTQPWYVPPVEISGLLDDSVYNVNIVRNCCDGMTSAPLELIINTTILEAPANFSATAGVHEVELDWDAVTGAASYTLQRALDPAFTSSLTTVYTGTSTAILDDELTAGITYYYRVKATAPYTTDSPYSTDNAIPTA